MSGWLEVWCAECGVNPVIDHGMRCRSCEADADFYNCPFCHGTSCTEECAEDEWQARPEPAA